MEILRALALVHLIAVAQQQIDARLNRRERRAKFMRGGGEKARFREAGFVRRVSGLAKSCGGLLVAHQFDLQAALRHSV